MKQDKRKLDDFFVAFAGDQVATAFVNFLEVSESETSPKRVRKIQKKLVLRV
jgi:hypothetical protein